MLAQDGAAVSLDAALEYPPVAMTGNTANILSASYGIGTYITTGSSLLADNTYTPYLAFDDRLDTFWHTNLTYNVTTGFYAGAATTTLANGTNYLGEWIQINYPSPVILDSFRINPRQDNTYWNRRSPRNFLMLGSNTSTSWTILANEANVGPWTSGSFVFTNITNQAPFRNYRLAINRIGNPDISGSSSVQIANLELHGYPVSSAPSDSSFFVLPSTEYSGAIRFESAKYSNYFIRQTKNSLMLRRDWGLETQFKADSAYYPSREVGGLVYPLISN